MKCLFLRFSAPKCLAAAALLGLTHSAQAQPTQRNTGLYTNAGSTYHASAFVNLGTVTNTGAFVTTNTFAGLGVAFSNAGPYTFTTGGANPVTDQFTGAGAQSLAGTVAPQFFNLTLANAAATTFAVTNAQGLDVAGTLALNNGLTSTAGATTPPVNAADVAGAIRLGPAASLAGTPGTATYVDGFVGKAGTAPFTYPLGATPAGSAGGPSPAGSPLYSPITLSNPGGSTLRYVAGASAPPGRGSFAVQGGGLQLTNVSTKEYYPLYAPVGGGLNTSITLPYTNFGPAGYVGSPAQLTVAGFDGSRWVNLSTTPTNGIMASTVTVTVLAGTDLSAYQALALASTSAANPLPVELSAFTASAQGNACVRLAWTTAAEKNSDRFEVERSIDGTRFERTGTVAAGGGSVPRSYALVDNKLPTGPTDLYYRLRQVDLDGTFSYSPVRTVQLNKAAIWTLYPNPANGPVRVLGAPAGAQLQVFDVTGRRIAAAIAGADGTAELALPQGLAAGTYVVKSGARAQRLVVE